MPLSGRNHQPHNEKLKPQPQETKAKKSPSISGGRPSTPMPPASILVRGNIGSVCRRGADSRPVRQFGTFTADLEAMADWLQECGVTTVAMEATGVYWIPVFQILEGRGLKPVLVNARQTKNVAGRKSDVQDCQWIQRLHTYGLAARLVSARRCVLCLAHLSALSGRIGRRPQHPMPTHAEGAAADELGFDAGAQ